MASLGFIVLFLVFCFGRSVMADMFEDIEDREITDCSRFQEQPLARLCRDPDSGLLCNDPTGYTKSDFKKERQMIGSNSVYTVFQGPITFTDATPRYCFDHQDMLQDFDINFDSDSPDGTSRAEFTTCRAGGHWTNGRVFCTLPECSGYQGQPTDADYYEQELFVTLNMRDLENIPTDDETGTAVVVFKSGPDPRLVHNTTANTTSYLSTSDFLALCDKYGPCKKGLFENAEDLIYHYSGRPPMVLQRKGSKIYLGLRHDPREFIYPENFLLKRCDYKNGVLAEICESPSGYHTWQKIWEADLPYNKEWLPLRFFTQWSHKQDCVIRVTDTEANQNLVDFKGPCGRYLDMKLGNYPYPRVGVTIGGPVTGHIQMRFRDIDLIQKGPVNN